MPPDELKFGAFQVETLSIRLTLLQNFLLSTNDIEKKKKNLNQNILVRFSILQFLIMSVASPFLIVPRRRSISFKTHYKYIVSFFTKEVLKTAGHLSNQIYLNSNNLCICWGLFSAEDKYTFGTLWLINLLNTGCHNVCGSVMLDV